MAKSWKNKSLSAEERAELLLKKLTPQEKCGMLFMGNGAVPRLGIPAYHWWNEALHGVARAGKATMFPQAIAIAATFTPDFAYQMGRVIAEEAKIKFRHYAAHAQNEIYCGLTMYSPNINIFRDPRWGRGHETYGECPVLTAQMGAAYVKGVQGPDPEHPDCGTTLKHFAVHSGPESLRSHFNAKVNAHDLNDTYFYAFRYCVQHARPVSVMTAYNALNKVPMSINGHAVNDILRKQWGFDGVVVTDVGTAVNLVNQFQKYPDMPSAYAAEIKAGVDVCCDCNEENQKQDFQNAFRSGLLTMEDIDRAVRRQLILKFKLGIFDEPEKLPDFNRLENKEFRAISRKISERSMVLLKNDGILPLDPQKYKRIAVIGPNAADTSLLCANYYGRATKYVTLLEGMLEAFGEDKVTYALGCVNGAEQVHAGLQNSTNMAEAESAAEAADLLILCVGLNPSMEGEIGDASNADASGDKFHIELPERQQALIKLLAGKGKPIILLNVSGSCIHIPEKCANAVLQIFYPGPEGGRAVADILTGKVNPSGRLPVTFYRSAKDLPDFEDYSMANRTYRYFKGKVQYPFGYGLSYTKFEYSDLKVPASCSIEDDVPCSVTVRNAGPYEGETAVLFFLSSQCGPAVRPLKQFAGSVRISLKPGKSQKVSLNIPAEFFRIVDAKGKSRQYAGPVTVAVEKLKKTIKRG